MQKKMYLCITKNNKSNNTNHYEEIKYHYDVSCHVGVQFLWLDLWRCHHIRLFGSQG